MDLLILYGGILVASYFLASRLRKYGDKFGFLDKILNIVVFAIIFIMGLRMGANEEIISQLGTIGIQAVGITVFVVAGSIIFVSIARRLMGIDRYAHLKKAAAEEDENIETVEINTEVVDAEESEEEKGNTWGFTIGILLCVAAGMAIGYLLLPELVDDIDKFQAFSGDMIVVGLCSLLACIGFGMGLTGQIVRSLKAAGFRILLFPVAAIGGSVAFGALYGLISPLTVREAMAISVGFGWYTLAPSIISDAGYAVAGAVSFMHNVIRETLGIIIVPAAAKYLGYIECSSIPGVASMDVCLPIVEKSCNEETVVYSFSIGLLMVIMVPVLLPLILG